MNKALFAGGCFWCTEAAFAEINGVIKAVSGYTGGHTLNPTYKSTSNGDTGHYEALHIEYNADVISYDQLLDIFWQNIDPFDGYGQFADKGSQYQTAIFYYDDEQKTIANLSKEKYQFKWPKQIIATQILPAIIFFPAEDYHQNYYKKNPVSYERYKYGSGRVDRLKQIFSKL